MEDFLQKPSSERTPPPADSEKVSNLQIVAGTPDPGTPTPETVGSKPEPEAFARDEGREQAKEEESPAGTTALSEEPSPPVIKFKGKVAVQHESRPDPLQEIHTWAVPLTGNNGEPIAHETFRVFLNKAVYVRTMDYARLNRNREVGGVLLGKVYEHPSDGTLFLDIFECLEAQDAGEKAATFTFTTKSMENIYQVKDKKFPEVPIVGWFHTHPSFGIFLSGMDVFIQKNFFPNPWQVAYVVDPVNFSIGFFRGKDGEITPCHKVYLYEPREGGISPLEQAYLPSLLVQKELHRLQRGFEETLTRVLKQEFLELRIEDEEWGEPEWKLWLKKNAHAVGYVGLAVLITVFFMVQWRMTRTTLWTAEELATFENFTRQGVEKLGTDSVEAFTRLDQRFAIQEARTEGTRQAIELLSQDTHHTQKLLEKLQEQVGSLTRQLSGPEEPQLPEGPPEIIPLPGGGVLIPARKGDTLRALAFWHYQGLDTEALEHLEWLNGLASADAPLAGRILFLPVCPLQPEP